MQPYKSAQVRAILLDIEGTTTPVEFVYQVLFPYASRKLEDYLRLRFHDTETRALIEALKAQHSIDMNQGLEPPALREDSEEAAITSLAAFGRWLIARDSKCASLKTLQGKIWQEGYEKGELRGEVFPDVPAAFERWCRQKRTICIYSSGSVLAQQLLFRTTPAGDLTPFLHSFFDTRIGSKTDVESYKKIAATLGRVEPEVLFISDSAKELDAARAAGMLTACCVRATQREAVGTERLVIHAFDEVFP